MKLNLAYLFPYDSKLDFVIEQAYFFMWCNHKFCFGLRITRSFFISRYIFILNTSRIGFLGRFLLRYATSFNEKETPALFPVISKSSLASVKTEFRILYDFGSFSGANLCPVRYPLPLCFQTGVFPS